MRFSIPGATLPGQNTPVPDLLVKSYWDSFKVKMQQKITRSKTKGGWVEEHWPPDLDTISVSGSTGAFILVEDSNVISLLPKDASKRTTVDVLDKQGEKIGTKEGLNNSAKGVAGLAIGNLVFMRRLSEASLSLESLADFYKNNGSFYETDGQVAGIRDIDMFYMGDVYRGYFTDFNHSHAEENPNRFTYAFTFRVVESFMTETTPVGDKNLKISGRQSAEIVSNPLKT